MKKLFSSSYMAIILMLIYIPIFVLMVMSFNSGDSLSIFQGFSDRWYKELSRQTPFLNSIIVSVFVAVIATVVSTIIGTLAAIGISKAKKVTQKFTLSVTNIPLVNADVITAVALMLLFLAISVNFGIVTLVLAHISFDIPYVIITVLPRLRKVDASLIDASLDLGAKPSQTLRKVVLPLLKPAIISAAAIAFAMSFDDFIISYFTGGDQVNVSTFIYTMKRIKPFINAFGTIFILIIGAIIFAWNIWLLGKSQTSKLKTDLLKGNYRDKDLYNLELRLIRYYHLLNSPKVKKSGGFRVLRYKIWRAYWRHLSRKLKTFDEDVLLARYAELKKNRQWFRCFGLKCRIWHMQLLQNLRLYTKVRNLNTRIAAIKEIKLIHYKERMRSRIIKTEIKQDKLINWIIKKKAKFEQERDDQEEKNKNIRSRFIWFNRTWKPVSLVIIILAAIGLLTGFYVVNNTFDLSVANWGSYIDNQVLNDFEAKYGVKVKYSTYDSNETLYNKLYTTNYDVMVPSDYMVKRLAEEGRLDKIDYAQLNAVDTPNYYYYKSLATKPTGSEDNPNLIDWTDPGNQQHKNDDPKTVADYKQRGFLSPELVKDLWRNNISTDTTGAVISDSIVSYCIPYFWGDIELVINSTQLDWLKAQGITIGPNMEVTDTTQLSWDILWKAAAAGKKVLLNNDYKNLFMLANEKNFQAVLPTSESEIKQDSSDLRTLLNGRDVSLQNDEIINNTMDGRFDFAFMYNGDAISADQGNNKTDNYRYIIAHPNKLHSNGQQEGTNIWSDNMVISKNSKHKALAYQFMNFVLQHYAQISEYTNYTSPTQQVVAHEVQNQMKNYARTYVPLSAKINGQYVTKPVSGDGPFLYSAKLDPIMVDNYNILISEKN